MSGLSKVTAERHQRQLQELSLLPGNDVCADCKARMPRWASWNLGIFLCVQCASVHRKIGTHVTKVKSLTLDSWTREQVESMKSTGNLKSNAFYNPDERRHPPPTNIEDSERDSELEKFIRAKYEYRKFVGAAPAPAKPSNGMLPPPPPASASGRQERARSTPLPAIIASKPSPPPPPIEEEPAPQPTRLAYRPSSALLPSTPSLPAQQQQQQQAPVYLPPQYTPQPHPSSALPATSPAYGDMLALQTGTPPPPSYFPPQQQQQQGVNPFHALQQQQQQQQQAYPSSLSLSRLATSPARSVSLPVSSPSALSVSTGGGGNPFFQQQQQQQPFLQPSPTGYSPFGGGGGGGGGVGPISIPTSQQQAQFGLSAQAQSPFLQPSPTGLGGLYFSPPTSITTGGTSPFSQPYAQGSSPFSPSTYSQSPSSPFHQQLSASPFAQPQQQPQQQQQQDHLLTFASNMLPQQRQPGAGGGGGTNPFGTSWQGGWGGR